ncbi:MAG: 3-hydroxybutyryl-CoA dehydrogenase [Rhodospirillaceae bacterium]|jgi:3-hydroxybutyryl-CoA dehydrogenase|nr:3-hydroxybutyryl-CoA dehydrogenase [Rhodospirillaceae bacterium]MBT4589992.1 3-hydroxybutyryl-CoA dehydrogenase [Rhodospirillaceae bacterium]MBT7268970.1 3-hydroxybutyryl-CoA dehydrogenase [Rhodospirillaceae bacterium]
MEIKSIGVIGAGQMGLGIAHVCAASGHDVNIVDIDDAALEKAVGTIDSNLGRLVSRGKISDADKKAALSKISTNTSLDSLSNCDLVIEAATENEEIKKAIYAQVCPILKEDAILSTNTSSISITRLAADTDRPGRFMGIHFMNPAPLMELIELIRGIATEPEVFETIRNFTSELGKTPVSSEDFPAFIVNRVLLPMINEAVYTLYEGVGTVEAIDTALKLGAHHPMGPLELADFIGLDTCLSVMQVLHEGLADTKYRPCPLLVKYVEAGWLGRKSGRGFYDYAGDVPVPTR